MPTVFATRCYNVVAQARPERTEPSVHHRADQYMDQVATRVGVHLDYGHCFSSEDVGPLRSMLASSFGPPRCTLDLGCSDDSCRRGRNGKVAVCDPPASPSWCYYALVLGTVQAQIAVHHRVEGSHCCSVFQSQRTALASAEKHTRGQKPVLLHPYTPFRGHVVSVRYAYAA